MASRQRDGWRSAPRTVPLAPDELHIYRVPLDQPEGRWRALAGVLSRDEQTRAERFHFERDRRRFVVGRASLRLLLARYLDLPPHRIAFRYGPYGKPELDQPEPDQPQKAPPLLFNLAHSDRLALYAITRAAAVGIDVERIRPLADFERMAHRYFAPEERAAISSLPDSLKRLAFFTCWTRKEAYLKALGPGISASLDSFAVSVAPDGPARILHVEGSIERAAAWSLAALTPDSGYVATVAVAGPSPRLRCWSWSPRMSQSRDPDTTSSSP